MRGGLLQYHGDPFRDGRADAFSYTADGLVICRDGRITAAGDHAELRHLLPEGVRPAHYPGHVLCAGFVDVHTHYPQSGIVDSYAAELDDWLERYTFPEEERFADGGHARRAAAVFCDELLRNGTTTALTFGTVHPVSVDALFEAAEARGMRMAAGKVLMDRNSPERLRDTAERGHEESERLIARWHGRGRNTYAVTPRFAPSSSREQLASAGRLLRDHPGTLLHTHVSEAPDEIAWVRSLFPERGGYLDVYDHYGLLGPRSVLAHGVHLTPGELDRCAETGTSLAHCPSSNLFLGSGLFALRAAWERGVTVGIGTDIGAGTSFSVPRTLNEAHKVAKLTGFSMGPVEAFYLATRGGARALGMEDTVGSLLPGREADLVVLDPRATPQLARRTERARDIDEVLFALAMAGDDRAVRATYVAGAPAHDRDASPAGAREPAGR